MKYKVSVVKVKDIGKGGEAVELACNDAAAAGWRLVSTSGAGASVWVYLFFERAN